MGEQQLGGARISAIGGDVQRGQPPFRRGVDIDRRAREQFRGHGVEALRDRDHEGGPAIVVVARVDVAALRDLVAHSVQVAGEHRAVQRRHRPIVPDRGAAPQWSLGPPIVQCRVGGERHGLASFTRVADFAKTISDAYATEGEAVDLGRGVHEGELFRDAAVRVPLATMNRHGLVAGATGTGKTKTLQLLAEQLSRGRRAGARRRREGRRVRPRRARASRAARARSRMADLGLPFAPEAFPVEFLALGGLGPGVPVRATVSDFGPQLLAKVLEANETQESSLTLVFHYADEKGLPLLDLSDLRALLTFLDSDAGKPELEGIGGLSSATVGVLLRSLVGLETGGGTEFFGEPQFDVADLLRVGPDGRGVVSCVELAAVQEKPALWSTALMWLVAELFEALPEAGDLPKPKLVVFLDEAHLLFDDATDAFLDALARTVRLIRSKGVGVFFVTQQPTDLSEEVLAQLGLRDPARAARVHARATRRSSARRCRPTRARTSTTSRRC